MRSRIARVFGTLICAGLLFSQAAATDPSLEGFWTVIGAEHGGKPLDALNGGIMSVTGERFEIRTAGGNLLKGKLQLDLRSSPHKMDLLHDNGLHWEAVYAADSDSLK
jgi:uncharacterized protein (TIGR03067 family)